MPRMIQELKPFWKKIVMIALLVFFQSYAQLYLPRLMSDIVDIGIIQGDIPYIIRLGLIMLLVAAAGTLCSIIVSQLSAVVSTGFARDIRQLVFAHVQSFSLENFEEIGTASLITRTTNDVTQLQQVLIMLLRMMLSAPIMCVGGIVMAVSQNAELSMLLIIVIPLLTLAIIVISRKTLPLFKQLQNKLDKLNLVMRERLTGIRVIRAFNRTDYESRRFVSANSDLTENAIKVNIIMAVLMPLMMLIMNLATIAVVWFGAIQISAGKMQVGSLMAFIQYIMLILFSLLMFSMMFVMLPRAAASAARISEVLDKGNVPVAPVAHSSELSLGINKGHISFQDVTFSYPNAEKPVLKNISFDAYPGQTTAIIGSTGSGKSTLITLLMRFYDVNFGKIKIDGIDIRELPEEELRKHIGFIPQKALLFSGSIAENIRFGKQDSTMDEIMTAARIAQAEDFILKQADGYATSLAQGGVNLSGGQKQRISIARALIRKAKIYLFDDSFSALDYKTDSMLRSALKENVTDATILIVAQRVSTVLNADQIIVLDDGEIVGIGKHLDLLEGCKVYAEIVSSQLTREVPA